MASFNKVILMGNLTRDPELKYTQGGAAVCSFGLAVNRKYKVDEEWKEDVCFVDITAWSKTGELVAQYLTKGSGVLVDGRLQFRSWVGQDGNKRSKLDVVAENVTFMPKGEQRDSDNGGQWEKKTEKPVTDVDIEDPLDDDEIPF